MSSQLLPAIILWRSQGRPLAWIQRACNMDNMYVTYMWRSFFLRALCLLHCGCLACSAEGASHVHLCHHSRSLPSCFWLYQAELLACTQWACCVDAVYVTYRRGSFFFLMRSVCCIVTTSLVTQKVYNTCSGVFRAVHGLLLPDGEARLLA